jgi:hypothetical protein
VNIRIALIATALMAGLATPAAAHFKDDDNNWYFYGAIYPEPEVPSQGDSGDPVSVVFYGGESHGDASCSNQTTPSTDHLCVYNHVTRAFPAMHRTICSKQRLVPIIGAEPYMGFRNLPTDDETKWVHATADEGH